jgi:hypothetical protein
VKDPDLKNKKYGIVWVITGLVVSILSVVAHLFIQADISRSLRLIRPISEMTAEPLIILTILLFLTGIILLLIGLYSIRFRKTILDK